MARVSGLVNLFLNAFHFSCSTRLGSHDGPSVIVELKTPIHDASVVILCAGGSITRFITLFKYGLFRVYGTFVIPRNAFLAKLPCPTIMWTGRGCNNLVNSVTITDPVVSIVVSVVMIMLCGYNCGLCGHHSGHCCYYCGLWSGLWLLWP